MKPPRPSLTSMVSYPTFSAASQNHMFKRIPGTHQGQGFEMALNSTYTREVN